MKLSHLLLKILLINSIFYQCSHTKFSLSSLTSYFSTNYPEEIIQKQIPIDKQSSLYIKNSSGNISITKWNQNSVQIKAIKQASKEEYLNSIDIQIQRTNKTITVSTITNTEESSTTYVHYELLVPQYMKTAITTVQGSITIENLDAPIKAKTESGNISISNTTNIVLATTKKGAITIQNVTGDIWATAEHGNIAIDKATKNLVAKTKKGAIYTTCSDVNSLNKISLMAESGNIVLSLPKKTNASIQAETKKGKLTCEHFITLKPKTVQLNKKTWNKMKKEVRGTIGSGDATIQLSTGAGNIKILETA